MLIAAFGVTLYMLENAWGDESDDELSDSDCPVLYIGDTELELTHNLETYLIIGTDASGNAEAKGKKYEGRMADFLLLYVMDKTDNTFGFLQIDRNTMAEIPMMDDEGNGEGELTRQICTANWYGGTPEDGCSNTVFAVGQLLGDLEIDGYYSLNMEDIGTLNHAVDGVEVTLKDDFSAMDPEMTKGKTLTLTDEQAEIFVRGRMSLEDDTNENRMDNQAQYMEAFQKKAKAKMGEDPSFVNDLYKELKDDAVTDIPQNHISVMANQMYRGEDLGNLRLEGKTKLGTTLKDGKVHEEFYANEKSIIECMATLCGVDDDHITVETGEDE